MFCCEKTQWFAMRVTYRRELDVKNLLDQQGGIQFHSHALCYPHGKET